MDFIVTQECLNLGLRSGAVLFRDVHVTETNPPLRAEIAAEVQSIRSRFPDTQAIRSLPEVISFQEILRKIGVNPKKEQPSVERLLSFALRRGDLPAINTLVDAYNLVSVRSLCSMGAHDLDKIALPVSLKMVTGNESFTPLGKDQSEAVRLGEFAYVDAQDRVLCRLDLLQADFSKVTTATSNVLLIVEGTENHSSEAIRSAFTEVIDLVTRHCGGAAAIVA